jgi:hypothetical protein
MSPWIIRLKDIIWPAVIAGVLAVTCIAVALIAPTNLGAIIALGLSAVTFALLAQRA